MSYVDVQAAHGIDPNLDKGRKVKDLYAEANSPRSLNAASLKA